MLTIESLKAYGANTDEGLQRCYGMADFYLKLVKMIPADEGFDRLSQALAANDTKAAFEAAHALKGVLGNLSLTPLYEPASSLTELLRAGKEGDYQGLLDEILTQRDRLAVLMDPDA